MTRPAQRNGLGLSVAEAEREVLAIEAGMSRLPESERVYREWREIIVKHGVMGVQVHAMHGWQRPCMFTASSISLH